MDRSSFRPGRESLTGGRPVSLPSTAPYSLGSVILPVAVDVPGVVIPPQVSTDAVLLLLFGQSNSKRREGNVTTSYPAGLRMFTGGAQASDRVDGRPESNPMAGSWFASTAPFSEAGNDGESWAPGYMSGAGANDVLALSVGLGGRHFRELRNGTSPWSNLAQALQVGPEVSVAAGTAAPDIVAIWDQGEADGDTSAPGGGTSEALITQAEYVEVLDELLDSYRMTYRLARQEPTATPDIWITQIVQNTTVGHSAVRDAQLEAATTTSGLNLIGPKYAYLTDGTAIHLLGSGHRLYAEYAAMRVAEGGDPVYATSAARAGAVITLAYNTISGDLVIDETAVPETTTSFPQSVNGFEAFVAGVQVGIASVTVSGTAVTITLDVAPLGPAEIRYAQMLTPTGNVTVTGVNSMVARGNLRDSGTRTAADSSTLYNWACHQTITTAS